LYKKKKNKYGIRKRNLIYITSGKGDRIYIKCSDSSKIIVIFVKTKLDYGYENLKDLAVAILRFEKEKQNKESIINDI
jgi:hypothetical protein